MKYHNTILGQMLTLFSRLQFQNIVNQYKGDHRSRSLKCWDQFIFILFGQLSSRDSLRNTVETYIGPYKLDHALKYKMEGPNAQKTVYSSI